MADFLSLITPQNLSNLVLSLTFIAILWYSYETRKMRWEITSQRQFEQRPVLVVYKRIINSNETFRIRNVGRGIAFSVNIEKIKLSGEGNLTFELGIYEPNILIPDEERDLEGQAKLKDTPILERGTKSLAVINPKYAKKNFIFKITYEDIERNKWFTEIETLEDGVRVKEIGKVG